jgi:hypothetical protein
MAGKKLLRLPFLREKPAATPPSSGGTTVTETDLYGKPTTAVEQEALRAYQALKNLAARDDLPPCAARNVRKALACMWQVTNDLDLQFEQLYDLGV